MPSSILVLTCLYESRGCASYLAVSVSLFSEYHRHVLSEYIAFCVSGQSEDFCRITGVVACLVQLLEDDVVPVYMASAGTPSGMFPEYHFYPTLQDNLNVSVFWFCFVIYYPRLS